MSLQKLTPSVSMIMAKVLFALMPGIVVYAYFFGWGIVIQIGLATLTACVSEYLILKIRRYPAAPFLLDGSAVLTAWLLALSFPPLGAWWMVVVATLFAVIVAKHLFGGIGQNIFNPAMVGWAVMMIAFPAEMSRYTAPLPLNSHLLDLKETLQYIFLAQLPANSYFDAIAYATPLDFIKTAVFTEGKLGETLRNPLFGIVGGVGMEWVAFAYFLGGLFLLQQRIISWHIPLGVLLGVGMMAGGYYGYDSSLYVSPGLHFAAGGTMLCAFFIATDPVTSPTTVWGKLLFSVMVGSLIYIIRVFGGFPDGVAFAVLIMNMCVPLMDQYTRPNVFGHHNRRQER